MDGGNSNPGGGRASSARKTDKTRRIWSAREEQVLLAALKDLVAHGWKSDNGFRTGYLVRCENAMKVEFPNTDLLATPHITSKITSWKKSYGNIVTAQSSGVGFNTTTGELDCTDEQWDATVRRDPKMRTMHNKPWPMFNDWAEVFGKDRATGFGGEDVAEAYVDVDESESPNPTADQGLEEQTEFQDHNQRGKRKTDMKEDQGESNVEYTKKDRVTTTSGKKQKSRSEISESSVTAVFGEFFKSTGERLETIAQRIGYDKDIGTARKQVFGMLEGIQSLTLVDKLDVCEIIGAKIEWLEIFMGLPEDARPVYVHRVLDRHRA
ncbi:hypothetical protein ACS0TY_005041 [Phlomoides rotata]